MDEVGGLEAAGGLLPAQMTGGDLAQLAIGQIHQARFGFAGRHPGSAEKTGYLAITHACIRSMEQDLLRSSELQGPGVPDDRIREFSGRLGCRQTLKILVHTGHPGKSRRLVGFSPCFAPLAMENIAMLRTRKLNNRHAALLALAAIVADPLCPIGPPDFGPFDENRRVVLAGNTRGEASRLEFDRGPVDDAFPMNGMQLLLRGRQSASRPPKRWPTISIAPVRPTFISGSPLLSMPSSSAPRRKILPGSATGCGGMGSRCMRPAPAA